MPPQSPIPYILSVLTFLPLLGAVFVMLLPRPKDLPETHGDHDDMHGKHDHAEGASISSDPARLLVNAIALFFSGATFLLSLALFGAFRSDYTDLATRNMQFLENVPWITTGSLTIHYKMGVDGVSLLLIVLTTFLMFLSVLYSTETKTRLKEFMVFLLLLETAMLGVFCALDLVLFYVFYEAMLIPMYFLIGIFGHENRIYAAIKFFLYTFAGSVFMLIAIVVLYNVTGTFDILALSDPASPAGSALRGMNPQTLMWLFGAFALAFMIKVPMFPFHTWLPDAHVEAPTAGSVILAGVMLKMGTYGFIRICLPFFPEQMQAAAPLFITLAIVGIIYGSLVAAVQPDAKKLVAYSSVAHLGFVILGIFSFTRVGMMGALVQNINHGISTPMLFFLVGMLYSRRHTRLISEYGGLKLIVPGIATMTLLATLSSIAVPFFNGFVGEFPILLGSWISEKSGMLPTALAGTGMILSAVYMLWWFQRLMLGPVTKPANRHLKDLTATEWYVLTPLVAIIFWFGLGSHFWTQRMDTAVNALLPVGEEKISISYPVEGMIHSARVAAGEKFRGLGKREKPNVPGGKALPQFGGGGGGGGARPPAGRAPMGTPMRRAVSPRGGGGQIPQGGTQPPSNATTPGSPGGSRPNPAPGTGGTGAASPPAPPGSTGGAPPANTTPGQTPGNPPGN